MRNLFFSNVNGSGDDVMIFTNLSLAVIEAAYKASGKITYDDACEVKDEDVGYYIYEPCWLTEKEEQVAIKLAAAA